MQGPKLITVFLLFIAINTTAQEIKAVKIMEVEKIIAESKTPLIINMWATWCMPCVEELPYFQKEVALHNATAKPGDSIRLLLVSLDFKESFPENIRKFIKKRNVKAEVAWLDETNADYFCPKIDAKWSGAIPATLFINNKTGYRNFIEEQISHEKLKKEIMAIL
ncbi:MAG: TlpA family protein disulfide reductase [Chitinophagaceae bacterium]|jgi:thiol-disulfide isomerase/thioredoxin|nr:TlpA family protein disulfide reductase [Chitinophagaceae bacterium]MBK7679364.1 TlpA family protein disulfide reductase [Chitinophagaceae bacterium]MBK9659529.1 TlpA family protein disulfide reductase [Chitinophagaceae bacterium]MBL0068508.1 TlpA family protein disulfide reductase [Chitinophagaceae bacterium]HQW43442.1 TlpA disulfide reductase family protein [Chitinophagaceae bacterium]